MSARASLARPAFGLRRDPARDRTLVPRFTAAPQLAAFVLVGGLVAWRYSLLLANPPIGRALAAMLVAAGGGVALSLTAGAGAGPRAPTQALRVGLVALTAYCGFRVAGVPAQLLWPWHWGDLGHGIRQGLNGLGGGLWPYHGPVSWSRRAVLLAVPAGATAAAALAFWPPVPRAGRRRAAALALLMVLYVSAAVNEPTSGWPLQGLALLAVLAAWIWLPLEHHVLSRRALSWLCACAVLAVGATAVLDHASPWLDYRAWDPFGQPLAPTRFQWDQTYGPIGWSRSHEVMLDVSAPAPSLWRVTTLDRFDGVRFLRSDSPPPVAGEDATDLPTARWYERATFTVKGLVTDLLVSPGLIVNANLLSVSSPTQVTQTQADGMLSLPGGPLTEGDTYSVVAYVPRPSVAQMRAALLSYPRSYLAYTDFDLPAASQTGLSDPNLVADARAPTYSSRTVGAPRPGVSPAADPGEARRILASPYAPMFRLAQHLAAGQRSEYDVAERIDQYLRHGYTYNEQPPRSAYPLETFLFGDGLGYCQQFSGAMALMLRMDGIPARVAVGFQPGSYDRHTGQYKVTAVNAHAWVEVYFRGIGWVPFDPTPPRSAPATATASLAAGSQAVAGSLRAIGLPAPLRRLNQAPDRSHSHAGSGGDRLALALGFGGALALLVLVLWVTAAQRLSRALSGDAEGAAVELETALRRLGYEFPETITLAQLERRLAVTHPEAASAYARLLRHRRYATPAGMDLPGRRERRALRRALSAGLGPLARARALLALPPAAARRPPRSTASRPA